MVTTKKDIRQFETFDGRFMSIRIGVSKSVLELMCDEDRMTLGSLVSGFEGRMFDLLRGYAEMVNESTSEEENVSPPWEESYEETSEKTSETSEKTNGASDSKDTLSESRSATKAAKKG